MYKRIVVSLLFTVLLFHGISYAQVDDNTQTGIMSLAWNSDGTLLATGNTNGQVDIRDSTGQIIETLSGHTGGVRAVEWNPNTTNILATGGDDRLIHIWDVSSPAMPIQTLSGHLGIVAELDWSSDNTLASYGAGESERLRIWNTLTWQQIASPSTGSLNDFHWSSDGTQFAVVAPLDVVKVVSSLDYSPIVTFNNGVTIPLSIDWHSNGNILVSGNMDGSVRLWDLQNKTPAGILAQLTNPIWYVAYNSDSTQIAVMQDNLISILDAESGEVIGTISTTDTLKGIAWSPDDTQIIYVGVSTFSNGLFEIEPVSMVGISVASLTLINADTDIRINHQHRNQGID